MEKTCSSREREHGGIVDMHCDTLDRLESFPVQENERNASESLRENQGQLDLLRMRQSGYLLQNFAIYVDLAKYPAGWERAMQLASRFQKEMREHGDLIGQVRNLRDMEENQKAGRMSAMLTVEEGGICEGRIERLQELYDLGVRMMTLTWNYPNELGNPASPKVIALGNESLAACKLPLAGEGLEGEQSHRVEIPGGQERREKGLTPLGIEFVREMERLGILADISHLSDEGAWDVLKHTRKPIVASHSNARTICGHPRNLPDELIRAIGERGGCIGLNYYDAFVGGKPEEILEGLARHARHIVKVGGMACLGLGSDFDGIRQGAVLKGAESMHLLWEGLAKAGFTQRQLDGFFSKNILRVYREL